MASSKAITDETGTLGSLLRTPYRHLQTLLYGEIARAGFDDIRPAHSSVFRHIRKEGSRIVDLAEQAEMSKQSMGYLVDYLHEHGYLSFQPDPTDGRAKRVCLTEKGDAFMTAALATSQRLEDEFAAQIGQEEMARLRALLARLGTAAEHMATNNDI